MKKFPVICLLLSVSLFLTGCSLADIPLIGGLFGGGGKEAAALTYWGLWESKEVIQPLIDEYVADNPHITIDYQERSFSDLESYKETLLTRLEQDEESSIDIMRIHNTWIPELSPFLSALPSSVLSQEDYVNRFYPVALKSARIGEGIYALPLEYDGLVLIYNTEMFREAQIITPPTTWEEFRITASKLTKRDVTGKRIDIAGAAIGTADNVAHASDILGLMWSQSEVDIPADLNTQAAADALIFYTNFALKDGVWDATFPPSVIAFANQKVAMILAPSWRILDILNLNPTIKLSVAPIPQVPALDGGISSITWASFWMEAVSKNSVGSEEAWKFLEWLSRSDQQQKLFSESSKIRAFGEPYGNKELASSLSVSKYLASVIEGAPYAESSIVAGESGNGPYVDSVLTAIRTILEGNSATSALNTTKNEIEQLQSRSNY